jgi:hypothetical protein
MSKEILRKKIHTLVDDIEDESALQMLMEDAAVYSKNNIDSPDNLTSAQWAVIEQAREQIKNGQFKTYESVKEHFAQWLTR